MRLTPVQIAVSLICGQRLPPPGEARIAADASTVERINMGRDFLVQVSKADFGYDLDCPGRLRRRDADCGLLSGRRVSAVPQPWADRPSPHVERKIVFTVVD